MTADEERSLLHQAVRLAEQGHGTAEPNPLVGCIIVNQSNDIVGEGFHERFGEGHAEVNALLMAGTDARGATAFVTLEPCNHQGKTPPCSQALIDAGIAKVVIGASDPHEEASGGIQKLKDSGVEVTLLEDELCCELLAPFAQKFTTGLPWITCKWAQSRNGSLETPSGDSPWISSAESQQLVHEERGCIDAIIVGVGTVIEDNPSLTVRNATQHRTPVRVVVDPMLRSPQENAIFDSQAPTIIACKEGVNTSAFTACPIIQLPHTNGVMDLQPLCKHLAREYDATHVMAEGGATLFSHIFSQNLANELWVFVAPSVSAEEPIVNMNTLVEQLDTSLLHTDTCGTDTVNRYKVNG